MAKSTRTENRKGSTPLVFKAILFLNINRGYWNEHTVKEAMKEVDDDRTSRRIYEDGGTANISSGLKFLGLCFVILELYLQPHYDMQELAALPDFMRHKRAYN